jgi:uncharacterized lipoprotein YehR (DUF1307 family)
MKKLIVLVMLMSLMFATGFRGNAWGTKEANIKDSAFKEKNGMYSTVINGEDIRFAYYFFQDKLFKGIYVCESSKYMYDYFLSIITSKYGEPETQDVIGEDDYNEYMSYDENIQYGNVILRSNWNVNGTEICVIASKKLYVSYSLLEVEEQSVKAEKAKTAELF